MKTLPLSLPPLAYCAAIGLVLAAPLVNASTVYDGSALLSLTLNSISNLNTEHPNDLSALTIFASFQQTDDPAYSYLTTSGDAVVTANNPAVTAQPLATGDTFSQSFSVNGSASDGAIDALHTGWFTLEFHNSGADSYSIDLSLAYQIAAQANGLFASSATTLDYGYTGDGSTGFDIASAHTLPEAETAGQTQSSSVNWVLTLAPGASVETFYADVAITGNLQATPVPVPAALWCFASGLVSLAGMASQRRKPSSR